MTISLKQWVNNRLLLLSHWSFFWSFYMLDHHSVLFNIAGTALSWIKSYVLGLLRLPLIILFLCYFLFYIVLYNVIQGSVSKVLYFLFHILLFILLFLLPTSVITFMLMTIIFISFSTVLLLTLKLLSATLKILYLKDTIYPPWI